MKKLLKIVTEGFVVYIVVVRPFVSIIFCGNGKRQQS
jgi:hypothetical protein